MKIWIDDVRPAPPGYEWIKSCNYFYERIKRLNKAWILSKDHLHAFVEEINLDHDAGDYASEGGDYIHILDWIEENADILKCISNKTIFKIHSMNPVGVQNMRMIIKKNDWREV